MAAPPKKGSLSKDADAEVLDSIAEEQESLRGISRATIGVTGDRRVESLRQDMRHYGLGWYPLLAIGGLAVADQLQLYGFQVLGPDISRSLGMSAAALGALIAVNQLMITVGALPMAAYTQRKPRRALIIITCGFLWTSATLFTGFVISAWGMLLVLVLNGFASGSTKTVQPAFLMDSYPPPMRVRAQMWHRGAIKVGQIVAPLMVGLVATLLGYTWRGVFVAMAFVAFGATLFSLGLRDPGLGKWEEEPVREQVRAELGGVQDESGVEAPDEKTSLRFFETMRRLIQVPTLRRIFTAYAIFGMWLIPLETFIFFYLEEQWGMGPGARGLFLAGTSVAAIPVLLLYSRHSERLFQMDPVKLISFICKMGLVMVLSLLAAVVVPNFAVLVIGFCITTGAGAVVFPSLLMLIMSVAPPNAKTHVTALSALFLDGVGGLGGLAILGGIDRRFGIPAAVAFLSVPGCVAVLVLRSSRKTVNRDIDRMIDDIVETEEVKTLKLQGVPLPMLGCRHVDFAYSGVQVLFDVNFAVAEGEMVALLGTNGAGKSTLLRVISGLGIPSRGRVYCSGDDITFLDCERRVGLGISHIPSGRAVFGSLSVVDNLRVYGYSLGRNRAAVDRGVDAALEAFPVLAEHRNQLAVTLSGGQQQMLALGKAVIVPPRLLLIDELSLGLAPIVVGALLDMVRQINAGGTAIVLVEQSVNIALSLVDHAYFMEKGEIRFDGPSKELLARPDLLRSVFLEGASRALE